MISALVTILVIALIVGLVYYVVDIIPVPQPMNRFAKIAAMIIGIVAVILVLLQLADIDVMRARP